MTEEAMKWEEMESTETMLAAHNGDKWEFSGSFSDLMVFVFSEEWAANMYAQYYETFWRGVISEIEAKDGPLEITLDMQFTFGVGTEEQVKEFMRDNKDSGPRVLVMHRGDDDVSMTSAWLRNFKVETLQASI